MKVVIDANGLMGKFSEIVFIHSKSFIYKIPVRAIVLASEEFSEQKHHKEGREPYKKNVVKLDLFFSSQSVKKS